jgi:hypothetical protein
VYPQGAVYELRVSLGGPKHYSHDEGRRASKYRLKQDLFQILVLFECLGPFRQAWRIAMHIPMWWSTTDLDATGILLQRLGSLSVGIAWGWGSAQRVAKNMWLWWALAIAIGFGFFILAEYRVQTQRKNRTASAWFNC